LRVFSRLFIALAVGFWVAFNAHRTPTASLERQANAKLLFNAKLRAKWAPDLCTLGSLGDGATAKNLSVLIGTSTDRTHVAPQPWAEAQREARLQR
jgi:hypothetical protein